jgi:preprotein translocase subunit SecD
MLEYPRWKYILVSAVLLFALLFALPNFFGDDYALQVARKDRAAMSTDELANVEKVLKGQGVAINRIYLDHGNAMARFADNETQLRARDVV